MADISKFFVDRHIQIKSHWISAAERFLKSQTKPKDERTKALFSMWLHTDIQQSTEPVLQVPTTRAFSKICVLQIVTIKDISTSLYVQAKKNNLDLEIETPTTASNEYRTTVPHKRMYLLELTDGKTKILANEHEFIVSLTDQEPGCKILICSSARFLSGILLLTPNNCQVLGGRLPESDR